MARGGAPLAFLFVAVLCRACSSKQTTCTAAGGCAQPQRETVLLQSQSSRLKAKSVDSAAAPEEVVVAVAKSVDSAAAVAKSVDSAAKVVVVGSHQQATVGIPIAALEETPSHSLLRLAEGARVAGAEFFGRAAPAKALTELQTRVRLVGHSFYRGEAEGESSNVNIAVLFAISLLVLVLLPLSLYAAAAQIYILKRQVPDRVSSKSADDSLQEWKFPLCGCLDEPDVCLCAFFCPGVRWSETMSFFPTLLAFWPSFFLFAFFTTVCPFLFTFFMYPGLWAISYLLLLCVLTCVRQYMRQEFNMSQGGLTYMTDCVTYLFCAPCLIAQEARQAEEGLRCGHEAVRRPEGRHAYVATA